VGQKTHPYGIRLGIIKGWKSRWFASKNFADLLQEDLLIRRYTYKRLEHAGVADIQILRALKKVTIDIHTAKPGIVIGRKGAEVDKLKEELQMLSGKDILLNIIEVKKPELSSSLVAQSIALQLVGRVSFRRAMKKAVAAAMKSGAEGIKVVCGGRLGGAEIARSEKYHQGRVPLHTLRADIDYATATAHTTYGCIGVKVWICKGEIVEKEKAHAQLLGEAPPEKEEKPHGFKGKKPHRKRPGGEGGRRPFPGGKKPSARVMDRSKRREDNRPSGKSDSGARDGGQRQSRPDRNDRNKSWKGPRKDREKTGAPPKSANPPDKEKK